MIRSSRWRLTQRAPRRSSRISRSAPIASCFIAASISCRLNFACSNSDVSVLTASARAVSPSRMRRRYSSGVSLGSRRRPCRASTPSIRAYAAITARRASGSASRSSIASRHLRREVLGDGRRSSIGTAVRRLRRRWPCSRARPRRRRSRRARSRSTVHSNCGLYFDGDLARVGPVERCPAPCCSPGWSLPKMCAWWRLM